MAFTATLYGIGRVKEVYEDEELLPYVQFKAAIEKRELHDEDEIAILNISGTTSHHILFLDSYNNVDEIKKELRQADAKINATSLSVIKNYLDKR